MFQHYTPTGTMVQSRFVCWALRALLLAGLFSEGCASAVQLRNGSSDNAIPDQRPIGEPTGGMDGSAGARETSGRGEDNDARGEGSSGDKSNVDYQWWLPLMPVLLFMLSFFALAKAGRPKAFVLSIVVLCFMGALIWAVYMEHLRTIRGARTPTADKPDRDFARQVPLSALAYLIDRVTTGINKEVFLNVAREIFAGKDA